jgi:hypothetical protein
VNKGGSLYGKHRRKKIAAASGGSKITKMRLLFVERGAATVDQPFANENFASPVAGRSCLLK